MFCSVLGVELHCTVTTDGGMVTDRQEDKQVAANTRLGSLSLALGALYFEVFVFSLALSLLGILQAAT